MKSENSLIYKQEEYVNLIANTKTEDIEEILQTPVGISDSERFKVQAKFGKNEIMTKKFNKLYKLLESFCELFNILLLLISISEMILFFTIDHEIITLASSIIIFIMILIAVSVDFTQSWQAHKTAIKMQERIENDFFVISKQISLKNLSDLVNFKELLAKIKQSELTIGDVLYLSVGDIVPADCRIIKMDELMVDESNLTGESEYISKKIINHKKQIIELENILFADTTIKHGNALAVVINIGKNNYSGAITNLASEIKAESEYEKSLKKITKILIASILTIAPIIFLITWAASGFKVNEIISPIIFSLSIVVALIPEALPAIIASNLKLGSRKIAKNKVIVKNIAVVQNMGSVNILATDKTGTLTLDEMSVIEVVDLNLNPSLEIKMLAKISAKASNTLENKIDKAINEFSFNLNADYNIIKTFDFAHETRISATFVHINGSKKLIVKGGFDEIVNLAKFAKIGNKISKINDSLFKKINQFHEIQSQLGNKIIAIASKEDNSDIKELTLEGFVCLQEKIKPDVKNIIKVFEKYAIDIKVLTGDNKQVSENLMSQFITNVASIGGDQMRKNQNLIESFNLFYKLSPVEKAIVINQLQKNNVVAFLGDGVNDSIALKQADVGISVNNACALAKHSADIIMLEKDLNALEEAFVQGRKTFANAVKYVKITIASNFGLLLTLLVSSVWFSIMADNKIEFLPMTPIQLLLQNLIFDFANLVFVLDKTDEEVIAKPRRWSTKSILPFALWNGLVHLIISTTNFLILGYGFKMFHLILSGDANALHQFQTAFFIELVITHLVLIISFRSEKLSIISSRPSLVFSMFMTFFAFVPFIIIAFDKLIKGMGLVFMNGYLNWWYFALLGLVLLGWCSCEMLKFSYKKVFKNWI